MGFFSGVFRFLFGRFGKPPTAAADPLTVTGTWEVPACPGTWEVPSATGTWENL